MAILARLQTPKGDPLRVGEDEPVRIMALVGSTSRRDEKFEDEKVLRLASHTNPPDIVADLSLRLSDRPLWQRIIEAKLPAATLPIYTARLKGGRIDRRALLDRAIEQIEGGVGMITIHPTATKEIVTAAQLDRRVPWTSRGGGIVIKDLFLNDRASNAYLDILPDLIPVARRCGTAISIGATFRSATILDADDRVQRIELALQAQLAAELKREGCSVIVEGPGHATPDAIRSLARRMLAAECPIMPLGPIPTDLAIGQDHVSAAIGATLIGLEGAAHILAAVTREEHTGGVPTIHSTVEAVDAARVAAHVINLHRRGPSASEVEIIEARSTHHTCVAGRSLPGCARCGDACPL